MLEMLLGKGIADGASLGGMGGGPDSPMVVVRIRVVRMCCTYQWCSFLIGQVLDHQILPPAPVWGVGATGGGGAPG